MPSDLSAGELFLAISGWRSRCVKAGVSLTILSGGMGTDGWLDQEVHGGVAYFVLHFRVSLIS